MKTFEPEERFEKLGKYFVTLEIHARYGITFERFVNMVDSDTWKDVVA